MKVAGISAIALACIIGVPATAQTPSPLMGQTSAPLFTDTVNKQHDMVAKAVFRVLCLDKGVMGTGFLHKSGNVITADHVVSGCQRAVVVRPDGSPIASTIAAEDQDLDLAVLKPASPLPGIPLSLSKETAPAPGSQVTTWGFPGGYNGLEPIVSVGYFSGSDIVKGPTNKLVKQWVVNAAFNHGNSGGPLIDVETNDVIGVVDNKLVPLSPTTISALNALGNNKFGFMYTATQPDGKTVQVSEAQVAAQVLNELASQVQLVIGRAIPSTDTRAFLRAHGIDP